MTTHTQRLDSVAEIFMGQAPSGEAYNSVGEGWPLLAGAGDFRDGRPAAKKFTREAPRICLPGDIIIGVRASIGDKVIADRKYCLGRGVAALRPRPEVHDRYLWHWLSVTRPKLEGKGKGATFKQITKEDVAELEIPLPPLEEQRRIAAILDKGASLTASQELHFLKLRELEGALLRQMDDEMPGVSKAVELNNLVESGDKINYGVVQPGVHVDAGVPLIRVGDLAAGTVDRSAMKFIDPAIESLYSRSRIRGNEILISCVGSIGIIAETRPEDVGSNIARAVARVPVSKDVNRTWLAAYLRSQRVQRYFTNELRTVSQPTLNIKQIQETEIILPPLEQQQAFAIRMEMIHRKCAQRVHSLQMVKQLANTLAAQVFTGGG